MKKSLYYLYLFLLVLIIIQTFVPLVFAQNDNPENNRINGLRDIFNQWDSGKNFSPTITKVLIWSLVSMVIFAITSHIPGLGKTFSDNEFLGILFAGILGFLAMAYITPEQIKLMMASYTALGITLGVFIPVIVLLGASVSLAMNADDADKVLSHTILIKCAWSLFFIVLISRLISDFSSPSEGYSEGQIALIIAVIFGTISMIFGTHWFIKTIRKKKIEAEVESAKEDIKLSTTLTKTQADAARDLSKDS